MVGVLEYMDAESFEPFEQAGRKDARLIEVLRARGVPGAQVVFLRDQEASFERVPAALRELLARTGPGDQLLFNYTGHGTRDGAGAAYFVAHDTSSSDLPRTGLRVSELVDVIEQEFRGSRVLLTSDSCYSGTLAAEVTRRRHRQSGPALAALTSVLSRYESTGKWTFTECLIDGFSGDIWLDADRDGAVRFDELVRHTRMELALTDDQHAGYATSPGFHPVTPLAPARPSGHPDVGRRLEALDTENEWCRARVVGVDVLGRWLIHYVGWGEKWDEWIHPSSPRLRELDRRSYPAGTQLQVEWEGSWWPGHVREVVPDLGLHLVHFLGEDDRLDSWVGPARLRLPAQPEAAEGP